MKRLLRMFDAFLELERRLDEKNFEVLHLRTVNEKLEGQLAAAHTEHKQDLRRIADAESYQLTRRKVFSGDQEQPPTETETVMPALRMTARASVRQAKQKFKDDLRELGAKSA